MVESRRAFAVLAILLAVACSDAGMIDDCAVRIEKRNTGRSVGCDL